MKIMIQFLVLILLCPLIHYDLSTQNSVSGIIKGPYLGQEPPGIKPQIFAPGIISTDYFEHGISFHPNRNELYFTRRRTTEEGNRIYLMKTVNGEWTPPEPAPFSAPCRESSPNFSPDGERLFFNSRRPLPENVNFSHEMNVWLVRKHQSEWGKPELIGSPIMDLFPMFVTQTKNGSIYFTGNTERGIYKAERINGGYKNPVRLLDAINNLHWAGHPFIDPEERYIIFDSNVDEKGTKNLHVSFRNEKGDWSQPFNINKCEGFPEHAAIPHVSFDGRYLFFSSQGDIYWVDASIIKNLRPGHTEQYR